MNDRSSALESIARPLYFMALLLVATPLVDFFANAWPIRLGEVGYRYGVVGLLSGFVLTPLLGLGVACALALVLGHRTVLRVLAILCVVGAVLLLVAAIDFSLDVIQLRRNVPDAQRWSFQVGALKALVKHLSGAAALAWLGLATRRALRSGRFEQGARSAVAPLVVPRSQDEGARGK